MTINMFDNPIPKPTPEKPRMQPEHFVAKWVDAGFSEKQASQEMFLDICAVVGHPTPVDYGDSQAFTFEKWVPSGVADAYLEGRFGWEFKGGDAQLAGAFNQLLRYQVYLKTPPLLIVSSFNTISPNPPMDRDGRREDSGRGEGVTSAIIRARIRVDGRLAGGLQALLGAPIAGYIGCGERDGGIGHGKRRSRTGLARVCGDVGLAG